MTTLTAAQFCDSLDTVATRRLLDVAMGTSSLSDADKSHLSHIIYQIILHRTPPPTDKNLGFPSTPEASEDDENFDDLRDILLETGFAFYS